MRLFLLSIILISGSLSAQRLDKLNGRIIDENGQPVQFANVGILDTWVGTASNEQGYFSLDISTIPESATLHISAISFKTFTLPIKRIENRDSMVIELKPHYLVLQELQVSSAGQDAKPIVQKALLNWHNNYPQQKYQLKGFYRELLRNDDSYVYLTEAAFTMQDRGYHKTQDKRFRLDALRKSDDMREMDSLDVYYDKFMSDNDLESIFRWDFIDSQGRQWSIPFLPAFHQDFINNHSFFLDSIAYYDNQQVYCISFYVAGRWEKYGKSKIEYNHLVIAADDYAIIEYGFKSKPKEITYTVDNKKGNASYLIDGEYFSHSLIKYKKYKDHYYPFLFSKYSSVTGGDRQKSSRMAFEKLRETGASELDYDDVSYNGRKLDPDKNNYYRHQQILITDIKNKQDGFGRIKNTELMNDESYIRDMKMSYNSAFWEKYNGLLIDRDLKAAKQQLEKRKSLEQQFIANGELD